MNDRDNTSNNHRYDSMNSSYGMSNYKAKTKVVNKTAGGEPVFMFLNHKNLFPHIFRDEFLQLSESLIRFVHDKKKENKLLIYYDIKEDADVLIEPLYNLTCKAYNLSGLEFNELEYSMIISSCKKSYKEAMELLEDIFCSRGEALNSLSKEDRELLFNNSRVKDDHYFAVSELKRDIEDLGRKYDTFDEISKLLNTELPAEIIEKRDLLGAELSKKQLELEREEQNFDRYMKEVVPKIEISWTKVSFYNP